MLGKNQLKTRISKSDQKMNKISKFKVKLSKKKKALEYKPRLKFLAQ